ncbi:hypothetical protein SAMN04488118_110129 [Epibacterium ulvae]|uniref:Probable membrane transporter protein n=2 Tax=Epibacterium ulvae TaxID=1156985 RepID=A0A1G5R8N7_9RHOB|nr:sulfite exporter TauE/SafE family protein [Epibacterium ulvae]SCZ70445.1 hypothetical protein SAMN04488118_110129 [Epibacterium ulvae]
MEYFFTGMTPLQLLAGFCVAVVAGTVKGTVGFGMPMILISGLSIFVAPDIALAWLILPTLATNGFQALHEGVGAAWRSMKRFRLYLSVGGICLIGSAQLVTLMPQHIMLLIIGVPVMGFALMQLVGREIKLQRASWRAECAVASIAGFSGGISGVWGPPTVAYLTALGTEKREQMRAQGVIYGLGSIALLGAHIGSGVVRQETLPMSCLMIAPSLLGMWLGNKLQSRIDQAMFKKATLVVLLVVSANLVRRGLLG